MGRERDVTIAIASTATLAHLSFRAFSISVRNEIKKRDKGCQIEGCSITNHKLTDTHHLVPECLENGKHDSKGDSYTESQLEEYKRLLEEVPRKKVRSLKRQIRRRIRSANNGIAICHRDHRLLHESNSAGETFRLKQNPNHPERPASLRQSDLKKYLRVEIVGKTLNELGSQLSED